VSAAAAPAGALGVLNQARAEWTKLRSTRAFYIQMGLALLLAVSLSALFGLAIGSTWSDLSTADQEDFDPFVVSIIGLVFAGIVLTITGVTLMSSEYTSGMIRLTMTVTPSRLRVLFGKALTVAAVTWAIGVVVVVLAFYAGQLVLSNYEGVPTSGLDDSETQRALIVGWLTTPLFPLIGLALGAIFRSTAWAITAVMALIFAPGMFGGLLPATWQENVLAYLPGNASDSLLLESDSIMHLEPVVAVVVIVAWLAVFFAWAGFLLMRRDV
jgi:ABC-type transport system involved in multi-copper enzyme maturation permease subunit